jgi:hypothetical protein
LTLREGSEMARKTAVNSAFDKLCTEFGKLDAVVTRIEVGLEDLGEALDNSEEAK